MRYLSALDMENRERCGLYAQRREIYETRVDPLRALYLGVKKGLESDKNFFCDAASTRIMGLGKEPGFAVEGQGVYQVVKHYAALAEVIVRLLRGVGQHGPWEPLRTVQVTEDMRWKPSLWRDGYGVVRSLWFVDYWSETREAQFKASWRGLGEAALSQELFFAEIFIVGQTRERRREGPLTRAYVHTNRHMTFSRRGPTWAKVFREDTGMDSIRWAQKICDDGMLADVHKRVEITPPDDLEPYIRAAISATDPQPRLAGCEFPSHCPFYNACWGGSDIEGWGRIEKEKHEETDSIDALSVVA